MLKDNERLEPLGNGVQVIVSDKHRFSTDTILLASFAAPKAKETAVELGSGCGAIPLIWNRGQAPKHTTAVEIQQDAANMLIRSVIHNDLSDKIEVLNTDLRCLKDRLPLGVFDLVVCNPPYKTMGSGLLNPEEERFIARHEYACTITDITKAAAALLRFGGRFCLCQRPERLCDVTEAFRAAKLEPKRLRFVQQRIAKAPKLILIEGKKGANPGGLGVLPTLIIEGADGTFSQEMRDIYGIYKDGHL